MLLLFFPLSSFFFPHFFVSLPLSVCLSVLARFTSISIRSCACEAVLALLDDDNLANELAREFAAKSQRHCGLCMVYGVCGALTKPAATTTTTTSFELPAHFNVFVFFSSWEFLLFIFICYLLLALCFSRRWTTREKIKPTKKNRTFFLIADDLLPPYEVKCDPQ